MAITFKQVQEYLNAISRNANLDPTNSRHGAFWNQTYQQFISGSVPSKTCDGNPVPIIDPVDKLNSAFYQILFAGWCGMPQMPKTGPFITSADYSVTLSDGAVITGDQIAKNIREWLQSGAPENG